MKKVDNYTPEQRKRVRVDAARSGVKLWISVYVVALLFVIVAGTAGISPVIGGVIIGIFAATYGVTFTWKVRARIQADIRDEPKKPTSESSSILNTENIEDDDSDETHR